MATKMISKMVTDRKKTASNLEGVLTTQASKATEVLQQMLGPHLEEGDAVPDLGMLRRLLGRRLAALRVGLEKAHEEHEKERAIDSALRKTRDEAVLELVDLVSRLRFVIDKSCGEAVCKTQLRLEGTLSRDPVVMQSVARRIVTALREGTLLGAATPIRGVALDLAAWAENIEEPLIRLDDALQRLAADNHETFGAKLVKSEAMAEYDRSYQATARILEDFFRYVGMTDWSDHVRPSRRSTSSASSEDEPVDSDSATIPPELLTPSQEVLVQGKVEPTTVDSRAAPAFTLREVLSEVLSD